MKFKRFLLGVALSVMMIFSTGVVSYAVGRDTITATTANVSLYGYVDYVNGVFWLKDTVYYNASITGKDVQYVTSSEKKVYVQAGSEKEKLGKQYLYSGRKALSLYGEIKKGEHGVLDMKCYDKSTTIYGYES